MARMSQPGNDGCRIYLITPPVLDPESFANRLAAALDAGRRGGGAAPAEGRR